MLKCSGREVLADGHKPTQLPAPLLSRLWLKSRMSSCQGGACVRPPSGCDSRQPHQFLQAARQHAAESPKLSSLRAARRQPAVSIFFIWGRGRQAMHLPCKQAYVGALPTDSTSLRPLRCGGRRLPRRSSESEGGLYRTAMRGFGSAGQFQMRETRPMHREKPHKLLQVGVTPTPAPICQGSDPATRL